MARDHHPFNKSLEVHRNPWISPGNHLQMVNCPYLCYFTGGYKSSKPIENWFSDSVWHEHNQPMYLKLSMIFSFFSIFPLFYQLCFWSSQDMAFHWHVKPPQCPGWTCSTEARIGNSQHFLGIQWECHGGNHISSESFSKHRHHHSTVFYRDIRPAPRPSLRGCYPLVN